MKIEESCHKHLFSNTWTKKLLFTFSFNSLELSKLVHSVLTNIASTQTPIGDKNDLLTDLKGRDKANLLLNNFSHNNLPDGDELIFIQAKSMTEPDYTLEFRCNTSFDSFQGSHHIIHKLKQKWYGINNLKPDPLLLGFVCPLKIENFRFGLERFKSKLAPLSLGYVPTVVDRILIDCLGGQGIAEISSEALSTKTECPFGESGEVLTKIIKEIFLK